MAFISSLTCNLGVTGITARFGEDIFDRLKKEKSIQAHDVTASTGPDGWTLTEEVSSAPGKNYFMTELLLRLAQSLLCKLIQSFKALANTHAVQSLTNCAWSRVTYQDELW